MIFLDTLGSMVSITLIAVLGWAIARRGWISPDVEAFMPRLLVNVVLPPLLALNLCTRFGPDDLSWLLAGTAIPAAAILATFAACLLAARALGVGSPHRRLVALGASLSNTGYIGIPVNLALFGDRGLPFLMLYFIANTVLEWTVGAYALGGSGGNGVRLSPGQFARRVLTPPLLGILAGLAVVASGLSVPGVVLDTCRYLGAMCTPLAMLYIGVLLARVDWKTSLPGRDMALALAGRAVLCPLVMALLVRCADIPLMMKQVFVIQAGMPVLTNITVVAAYFGADRRWAGLLVAVSTAAGIVTVPVWMALLDILL